MYLLVYVEGEMPVNMGENSRKRTGSLFQALCQARCLAAWGDFHPGVLRVATSSSKLYNLS